MMAVDEVQRSVGGGCELAEIRREEPLQNHRGAPATRGHPEFVFQLSGDVGTDLHPSNGIQVTPHGQRTA
jgi:hypothetical protein